MLIKWKRTKIWIWATPWENMFMLYANYKGADQPAYPLFSEAEQVGLSLTGHKPPKTSFLMCYRWTGYKNGSCWWSADSRGVYKSTQVRVTETVWRDRNIDQSALRSHSKRTGKQNWAIKYSVLKEKKDGVQLTTNLSKMCTRQWLSLGNKFLYLVLLHE